MTVTTVSRDSDVTVTGQRQRQMVVTPIYRLKREAPPVGRDEPQADDVKDNDIARALGALTTEVRQTRKLVEQALRQDGRPGGVERRDDGQLFLPGTGTTGEHELSDEAQAAVDQLDRERPT